MPENCEKCQVAARVDALEKEFDRYRRGSTETHRQMFDRIGALEQGSTKLETKLDSIGEKLDELSLTVKALVDKPAKRWEGLVEKALWAVAAAVIAFLLGRVGL